MGHEVIANGRVKQVKVCDNGHTYIDKECPYCCTMPRLSEKKAPPRTWEEACKRHFKKN